MNKWIDILYFNLSYPNLIHPCVQSLKEYSDKLKVHRKRHFGYSLLGLIFYTFLYLEAHAGPTSSVAQTQNKMKQLDAQINSLQQNLNSAHNKQELLNKELSETEKQIGDGVRKLRDIQVDIKNKENKISDLQKQVNQLNEQLSKQQQLLANHVRARYQMGEYQPLKLMLNQNDPNQMSRILTYYQYIIKSRQQLIERIDATKASLGESKEKLRKELVANQQLKDDLTQHQQQLQQNKSYHTTLIKTLNQEIQDKQNTLRDVRKNKENLAHLLKSLTQQSMSPASKPMNQTHQPFSQMRKKLPLPIQSPGRSLRKMNQGVTFFAEEGTVVTAVYPGKVVFSDWLKGYGLLLIIDHGQGFMTLYAHNQSLFKSKGQYVLQNEQIASVGHSGGIKQNGLYFEIRLRGKAIPPLSWLF